MINILKKYNSILNSNKINFKGSSLKKKYLIIESDDWGAIRMPSKEVLNKFISKGFNIENSIYKYDALASNEDLDALFNTLQDLRDSNGTYLPITANVCVANPDFVKIKESGFKVYHYEHFTTTLANYPDHHNAYSKWRKAIAGKLFKPQFHCREHLNVKRWMKALNSDNEKVKLAFDHHTTYSGYGDYSFMEAFDWDSPEDVTEHAKIVEDGLKIFEQTFGFKSASFIAPCYNWDTELETPLYENEITILQGVRSQLCPTGTFDQYNRKKHYFGEANAIGQHYNIRNCFLEPSMQPGKDWVDNCMAQIANAFFWGKPAVICSHRINYIGVINEQNRDRGLRDIRSLIKKVIRKWPDVEFTTTDQLQLIFKGIKN